MGRERVRPWMSAGATRALTCGVVACAAWLIAGCGGEIYVPAGSGVSGSEVEWTAAIEKGGGALLIMPATALRGSRTYGLVLTRAIAGVSGRSLQASADFRKLLGVGGAAGDGPRALFDGDVEAPDNPYPEARLVREGGTVRIPDRFALRGMPDTPAAATARALLRETANELETLRGFSTTAPVRIAVSGGIDLETVTPASLLFFERHDGRLDLEGALAVAAQQGIGRADVALAISFPTQPIEDDLRAVRARLLEAAARSPFAVVLDDPEPGDDLAIGVFSRGDGPYDGFLAGEPAVGAVVAGLFSAPDFRDVGGRFDPGKVSGSVPPLEVQLDFLLTLPAEGTRPYPVAILQHGFGGSNAFVLALAGNLARQGIAAIGISAVSHGRRGSPIDFTSASVIESRDMFRQTHADLMSLVRAIEAGIDVDADGQADVSRSDIRYLGVSLGGILGSTLAAVEDRVRTAVLNVAGGRIAFLGHAPAVRPIYTGLMAQQAGLPLASPEFQVFLDRMLEIGQQGLDPADGLNFARRWTLEPFAGVEARRVLMQEGIGDDWVINANTEALAAAGGLPANTPAADPGGVSGLWRFDPPGGHGILWRGDVLAQAVRFLASDGTEIVDPSAAP